MWIEKINKTCFEKESCLVLSFQFGALEMLYKLAGSLDLKWVIHFEEPNHPRPFKRVYKLELGENVTDKHS